MAIHSQWQKIISGEVTARNLKLRFGTLEILQWTMVIAIFFFLGRTVWGNWIQVKEAPFTFSFSFLLLSTLTFVSAYFVQVWAWYVITLKLKIAIPTFETLESWFYSQLGKYLPGKVWLLFARIYSYESKGKSRKTISLAVCFEALTNVMAAGLVSLFSLFFLKETRFNIKEIYWWLGSLCLLGFVFLHPRVLQKIVNGVLCLFKKEPVLLPHSYSDILSILLICVSAWLLGGFSFYLFVHSVFPVPVSNLPFLTGALAISCILGLAAFFAPGGLGVREGALVYLLSFTMPGSVAVVLSVLTRLWTTLIEIGLIGVIYLVSQYRMRPKEKDRHAQG